MSCFLYFFCIDFFQIGNILGYQYIDTQFYRVDRINTALQITLAHPQLMPSVLK